MIFAVSTIQRWGLRQSENERGYPAVHAFDPEAKKILCGRDIWFHIGAMGEEHVTCKQCQRVLSKRHFES